MPIAMRSLLVLGIVSVLALRAPTVGAVEVADVQKTQDKLVTWLFGQYDWKNVSFGKAKDLKTLAVCVIGLGNSRRDYKENSGPFITEPLKAILAQQKPDGSFGDPATTALAVEAIAMQNNPKHAPVLEKAKGAPANEVKPVEKAEQLQFTADPASLEAAVWRADSLAKAGQKEITLEGKPVKWAEVMAESLVKLHSGDAFCKSDDILSTGYALKITNIVFKALK